MSTQSQGLKVSSLSALSDTLRSMTPRPVVAATLVLAGFVLGACAGTPASPSASTTVAAEATATPAASAEAELVKGTRENPIPYGEPYTFEDIGEMGGPAWKVTIDEPRDMSAEILASAVEIYGDEDESYLASSRPPEGTYFLGYTGSVERLLDFPASPGADLETDLIGSDGQTYTDLALGFTPPEEYISNISEMYAPAVSRFADVQVVPLGVTAGQVLVTMLNTGERVYFGVSP